MKTPKTYTTTCSVCSNTFSGIRAWVKYCSEKCRNSANNRRKGEREGRTYTANCVICGQEFTRARTTQIMCSPACAARRAAQQAAEKARRNRTEPTPQQPRRMAHHDIEGCPFCEDFTWMYDSGASTEEIASRIGCTVNSLEKRLARHGRTKEATVVARAQWMVRQCAS